MIRNNISYLSRYVFYNKYLKKLFGQPGTKNKIIVNSVSKSGTHLVMKALDLFPGVWRSPIQLGRQRLPVVLWSLLCCPHLRSATLFQYRAQKNRLHQEISETIPIDSDSPFLVPEESMEQIFNLFEPGWFVMGHLPYSELLDRMIQQYQVKMVLIFRDPRDIVISHAHYLAHKRSHYMFSYYQTLADEERIMASINGVPLGADNPRLLSIRDRVTCTLPWMRKSYTYTTCFEKLIGFEGGGSRDVQLQQLQALANHIEISVTDSELAKVADHLFGGTRTFRKGTIGKWRTSFSLEHREVCKELIGDLLIELGYETDFAW